MPSKKDRSGYIYILYTQHTDSKRYKIGFTKDVNRRLKERQSPYPEIVIKSVKVINAASSEKILQSKYADCNKYNEWFEFEDDQLASVLQDMDELERISSSYKVKKECLKLEPHFIIWCRKSIKGAVLSRPILGNFSFLLEVEKDVFNAIYFKSFDYSSIDGYAKTMIKRTYEEVRKQIENDANTLSFKYNFKSFNIVFCVNDIDSAVKVGQLTPGIEEKPISENIKYCLFIFYRKKAEEGFGLKLHQFKIYSVDDPNNLKNTLLAVVNSPLP